MKFLRGFLSFIAVLLCIVLFASTLVTMLVADVRVITSKDNLKTIINQFITGSFSTASRPAGLAAGSVILFQEEEDENEMMGLLVDKFYDIIAEQYGEDVPFTEEEVAEFVKESTLPEFVSDKAAGIVSDILTGEETTTITAEDVQELIEENKELLESTLQVEITDEFVSNVTTWVEQADVTTVVKEQVSQAMGVPMAPVEPETDPDASEAPGDSDATGDGGLTDSSPSPEKPQIQAPSSSGGIVGDVSTAVSDIAGLFAAIKAGKSVSLPTVLNILRSVTTTNVLLACIGVCLILMLLIFVCKLDRWYAALRNCGIVFLVAGVVMLLPVVAGFLLPLFIPDPMVTGLAKTILNMTALVSGGVAGGGLVMIIVGGVMSSVIRRRKRLAAEQAYYAPVMEEVPVPEYFAAPECGPEYVPYEAVAAQEVPPVEVYEDAPVEYWVAPSCAAPAEEPVAPAEEVAEVPAEEPAAEETAEV